MSPHSPTTELPLDPGVLQQGTAGVKPRIKVFMMDLWCIVPYYTGYLCNSLREHGIEVTLGSISYQYDLECFRRQGIRNAPGALDVVARFRIQIPILRKSLKLLESVVNMVALVVRFAVAKPDVIHVQFIPLVENGIPFELWLLCLLRRFGSKLVYTVHNELPMRTGERSRRMFHRVYRTMDVLICHTPDAKNSLMRNFSVPAGKICVIPIGPQLHDIPRVTCRDARKHIGISDQETVVLWQGWIKPYKGIAFLLEAWRILSTRIANARLLIAGSGPADSLNDIRQAVSALGLQDSVTLDLRFLAFEEVSLFHQAADIVVYPYREITTSAALMTGLSHGKAVVATTLPGFRQLLKDGVNSSLVDFGDTSGLAEALIRLIQNPQERERLSKAALNLTIEGEISWPSIGNKTAQCYRSAISRTPLP